MTRWAVSLTTLLLLFFAARGAHAQRLVSGAGVGLGSGLERSDLLQDQLFRKAPTRLIVPLDFRVDEDMAQGVGIVGLVDIAPRVAVGVEPRYMRWLGKAMVGFVGAPIMLLPRSLIGIDVGLDLHIPVGKSGVSLFLEPSFAALPLGSDLPGDHVILWVLLAGGIHASL